MSDKTSDKRYKITLTENQLALVGTAVEGMMNDLISRQAAIDAVGSMLRRKFGIGGDLAEITLAGLPSAQADSKELSGTHKALDTVSRQAVIEAINKIFPTDPMRDDYTQGITCGAALANIYVAQLPSAQPKKRTEERAETHACDLIDREAAVDAIYHHLPSVSRTRARTMLHEVPSAQPEIKPIDYQDCANAMLRMWMDEVVTDGEYNRIMDKLNAFWRTRNEQSDKQTGGD